MYGVDETLDSIGGESTNANTGCHGGTFTLLEKKLGRKLMWLVCFLHTNELPLCHLIEDLDEKITSDHTFSGPLGKTLADAVNFEVNPRFLPLETGQNLVDLHEDVINDLSTDQKYGYQMAVAIKAGKVPLDLANREIGPVCHFRWLTTANRFMRIYISKHGFTGKNRSNLKMLVEYITGVYYPMWFESKVKNCITEDPRHILKQLELVRLQCKQVQNLVAPHVARSAWFSHSEDVILALLCSHDKKERRFAVEKVVGIRQGREKGDRSNRERVHVKNFNQDAKTLPELCTWDSNVFEPVLTCQLSLADIENIIEDQFKVEYKPLHRQSIERAVKQVTRACEAVHGAEARDGFIRAGVASMQLMPKNRSKKDLKNLVGNQ